MLDIIKLAKLLEMTSSSFDGEVLSAIRRANFILKSENKTWSDLFQVKQPLPFPLNKPDFSDEHIRHMLVMCIARTRSKSGLEFLKSLQEFYRNRGYLTGRQLEALGAWFKNI